MATPATPDRSPLGPRRGRRLAVATGAAALVFGALAAPATAAADAPSLAALDAAAVAYLQAEHGLSEDEALARLDVERRSLDVAETLDASLGHQLVMASIDPATGELVVTTATPAAAPTARAAGASAVVDRSAAAEIAELEAASASLSRAVGSLEVGVPGAGVSWAVDADEREIVVTAPTGDSPAVAEFLAAVDDFDVATRVEFVAGGYAPARLVAGESLTKTSSGSGWCSAGFNAAGSDGTRYVLFAGHCAASGQQFYDDGALIGSVQSWSRALGSAGDYSVIKVDSRTRTNPLAKVRSGNGSQGAERAVKGTRNPTVGMTICKFGGTTSYSCGDVSSTSATGAHCVGWSCVTVGNLFSGTACVQGGDSGGPVFNPSGTGSAYAVGIVQGGSGNCPSGTGRYMSVNKILDSSNYKSRGVKVSTS